MPLAPPAANDGDIVVSLHELGRRGEPPVAQFAVAVDELQEAQVRMQGQKALRPFISGARGRELLAGIERDHVDAEPLGEANAIVRRAGVDVDDLRGLDRQRVEASAQPLALVSADDDGAEARRCGRARLRRQPWKRQRSSKSAACIPSSDKAAAISLALENPTAPLSDPLQFYFLPSARQ